MFLAALSLSFISKSLGAIIMKSSITQIERRFDISSSTVGLIDGSFEIGKFYTHFDLFSHQNCRGKNCSYMLSTTDP